MLGETANDIWASTFHSTCARILRRDGERIGYSSHFTVYDTDDQRRLMKNILKELGYFGKKHHAKIDFERDFPGKGFFNLAC